MQIIVIEKKKKRLIQEIRLTLDALPVLARNDPVTKAVSLWIKIKYFVQKPILKFALKLETS